MHNGPHSSRLPGTPDEADLLAWVEGESLSAEANASVVKAMQLDPVLARQLERMRGDRLALQSLGEERAPGGLIEAVESALQPVLERELLLGLKDGEPAESHPVVSMVRPEKRGIFQTFLADKAGRRMAMAASLLVLIGGATWWATVTLSGGSQNNSGKLGPIASGTDRKNELPLLKATESTAPNTKVDEGTKIAAVPVAPANAESTNTARGTADAGSSGAAAVPAPEAPMTLAAAEVVGPVKTSIDPTFAAELARERKLVIRVVSSEAGVAPRRVCDRIKKECNSAAWKLAAQVPSELTVALDAKPFDKSPAPIAIQPEVPAFAGSDATEHLVGPPAPRTIPVIEEAEPQPVYVVQARLDATTLSQLKSSLEKSGRSADEVVFEERYEALPLASGGVLTPQAVLWWGNSPAGWTNWGEVPVVIETR